jgi:inner membrane protein
MHREGHYGLNALLYAPFAFLFALFVTFEVALWGALIVVGLATIPDIDLKISFIKHRGITHTAWFALLVGFLAGGFTSISALPLTDGLKILFGFVMGVTGIIGHLLGDAMTPMGVRPWRPVRGSKYTFGWFKARNKIANYGFMLLGGVILLLALGLGLQQGGIDIANYGISNGGR